MDTKQLYELISAYVDGELNEVDSASLLKHAKQDERLSKAIESEKKFKKLLKSRLHRVSAPAELKSRINTLLASEKQKMSAVSKVSESADQSTYPVDRPSGNRNRFLFSFAALFLIGLFLMLAQQFTTSGPVSDVLTVEDLTYVHYANHSGQLLPTELAAANTTDAQIKLKELYGCNITVPELQGARFAGVIYADFYEGFHTPMLKYEVADGDNIYMFAFESHLLEENPSLIAYDKAENAIVKHDDVYIKTVNSHDVVSWKWGEVWYTAVSAHRGDVLAAMLPH
ncbi:MAG: hypothetical protein LAT84_13425 [Balneolia bacterium]|nr:hypothetical protein [Balneolia bacterium]